MVWIAGLAAVFALIAAVFAAWGFLLAYHRSIAESPLSARAAEALLRAETDRIRAFGDGQARDLREELGTRIDAGAGAIRAMTEAIGQRLDGEIARMGQEAQQNRDGLRRAIEDALGQYGVHQKERLEAVTAALSELTEKHELSSASLRQSVDGRLQDGLTVVDGRMEASAAAATQLREEVINTLNRLGEDLRATARQLSEHQQDALKGMGERLGEMGQASERGQEKLREALADALSTLRHENAEKLEQMRQTVDEKLQGTLERRIGESFLLVTQQLRQVHEGLGEMQKLALDVGDLKRVMTNVKARGTWGETQLAGVLEDMLAPDQYLRNVQTKEGSAETVEFCIKIPLLNAEHEHILLPIDAKFPVEDYERLVAAADSGDVAAAEQSAQRLEARFRACAKDIHTKYVAPPQTTDYAVMYVPSEGLYAEIMKRPGVHSTILREYNVVIAGPSNLMALLNAVQAVSRSVTIQNKAAEIQGLLLRVQSEFAKYGKAVRVARRRAESTVRAMEKLDTRQKVMGQTLKGVKSLEGVAAAAQLIPPVLDLDADDFDLPEEEAEEGNGDETAEPRRLAGE